MLYEVITDKIIAISEQTKADLVHFMQVDEAKIEVLYQSINPIFFEKNSEEALHATREKYRLPKEFILLPGTLEKRKNQANVLKAIIDQRIDMPVVIVGKMTNYMRELKPLVVITSYSIHYTKLYDSCLQCLPSPARSRVHV